MADESPQSPPDTAAWLKAYGARQREREAAAKAEAEAKAHAARGATAPSSQAPVQAVPAVVSAPRPETPRVSAPAVRAEAPARPAVPAPAPKKPDPIPASASVAPPSPAMMQATTRAREEITTTTIVESTPREAAPLVAPRASAPAAPARTPPAGRPMEPIPNPGQERSRPVQAGFIPPIRLPEPVQDAIDQTGGMIDRYVIKPADRYVVKPVAGFFRDAPARLSQWGVPMHSVFGINRVRAADRDVAGELEGMPRNSNAERKIMPRQVLVNENATGILTRTGSAVPAENLVRMALGIELDQVSAAEKQAYHNAIERGLRTSPFERDTRVGRTVNRKHDGLDISRVSGSPLQPDIYPTIPGIVTYVGGAQGYGYAVEISTYDPVTNKTTVTRYGHMDQLSDRFVAMCRAADEKGIALLVDPSVVVGRMGSTGRSSGPHLHYEVREYDGPPSALARRPIMSQASVINGDNRRRRPDRLMADSIHDGTLRGTDREPYSDEYALVRVDGGRATLRGQGDFISMFRQANDFTPAYEPPAASAAPVRERPSRDTALPTAPIRYTDLDGALPSRDVPTGTTVTPTASPPSGARTRKSVE